MLQKENREKRPRALTVGYEPAKLVASLWFDEKFRDKWHVRDVSGNIVRRVSPAYNKPGKFSVETDVVTSEVDGDFELVLVRA